MALIEIVGVRQIPFESDRMVVQHLDAPLPGACAEVPEFEIDGWVFGRDRPVIAVEVAHGDQILRLTPADLLRPDVGETFPNAAGSVHSGYKMAVPLTSTPPEFLLEVRAVLGDGTRVALAAIAGRHRISQPYPPQRLTRPAFGNGRDADDRSKSALDPLPHRWHRVSIVIPVYDLASLTRQCVNTLLGQHVLADTEIIVVDDGSTDATARMLADYAPRVRVLTHSANSGFATACNKGAALGTGEYVLFLNNDTTPLPGWLDALVGYAETHPAATVVGSKLLFPEGKIQHCGVVIGVNRYPRHLYAGFPADHPAVNKSRQMQIVTAGCALFRRKTFMEFGGFDPAFTAGWEDVDICLRLGEAGHESHYCHESVVYHLESVSRDPRSDQEKANRQLYASRWFDRVKPDDVRYYLEDDLLSINYSPWYPLHLTASPLLAVLGGAERDRQADRQLAILSWQVRALSRRCIELGVQLHEAELGAALGFDSWGSVSLLASPVPGRRRIAGWLTKGAIHASVAKLANRVTSPAAVVASAGCALRRLVARIFR